MALGEQPVWDRGRDADVSVLVDRPDGRRIAAVRARQQVDLVAQEQPVGVGPDAVGLFRPAGVNGEVHVLRDLADVHQGRAAGARVELGPLRPGRGAADLEGLGPGRGVLEGAQGQWERADVRFGFGSRLRPAALDQHPPERGRASPAAERPSTGARGGRRRPRGRTRRCARGSGRRLGPVLARVEVGPAAHRVPRRFGLRFASGLDLVRRLDLFPPRVAFDRPPGL